LNEEEMKEEIAAIAEVVANIMNVLEEYETPEALRGLSSCLSMVIVQTAPSREGAENLIKGLCETILGIIETMDNEHLAGWNENEGHTLQ
jgi:hypothetical protein